MGGGQRQLLATCFDFPGLLLLPPATWLMKLSFPRYTSSLFFFFLCLFLARFSLGLAYRLASFLTSLFVVRRSFSSTFLVLLFVANTTDPLFPDLRSMALPLFSIFRNVSISRNLIADRSLYISHADRAVVRASPQFGGSIKFFSLSFSLSLVSSRSMSRLLCFFSSSFLWSAFTFLIRTSSFFYVCVPA